MTELLITDDGAIRFLTLNRPEKRNALNDRLIDALKTAIREVRGDENIRAVVLRGAGKDFCSGADLSALQKISNFSFEENIEDARGLSELFSIIREVDVPVIAAVHGRALAGGCGLATGCDVVLATESARFGYPEVKIGFVPAIVTAILRRNVSEKAAFELTTQGFEFSSSEAKLLGLVNTIVGDDTFEKEVLEYARRYEKVSRSAVALTKKLLYEMDGKSFADALELGAVANAEARMTGDCKAGIARFLGKTVD
jgi:methylglutaconyl-CoA hydratase